MSAAMSTIRRFWWGPLLAILAFGPAAAEEAPPLTLRAACESALRQHPRISIAELKALAAQQEVIAARAALFPQVSGNLTAVGNTDENNRIANAGLTTSSANDRVSLGIGVSQLLTDFGRTNSLAESARFKAAAEEQNTMATRAELLLQVHVAYFAALQAQSVLQIADDTLKTRQLLVDQVTALAANKLKSDLDVAFAEVGLQEAQLLLVKSQSDWKGSCVVLATLLGCPADQDLRLVEEPQPPAMTADPAALVDEAFVQRPELGRLRYERAAADRKAQAERQLRYPTINALAATGVNPAHTDRLNDYYTVAGVTMTMTLRDGCRIAAQVNEAELKTSQIQETLRDTEASIARDVHLAWLNVVNAAKRVEITAKMVEYASRSFALAQARYNVGASSIVELSQSQLSLTSAAISQAGAKYEYLARRVGLDFQLGRIR